jgi:hypothetical protein
MTPAALARRALDSVPTPDPDEPLVDWHSRAHRWAIPRPVIDQAAAVLMRVAADGAEKAVTKPESNFVTRVGRPSIGGKPMTAAERQQRHRESRKSM